MVDDDDDDGHGDGDDGDGDGGYNSSEGAWRVRYYPISIL